MIIFDGGTHFLERMHHGQWHWCHPKNAPEHYWFPPPHILMNNNPTRNPWPSWLLMFIAKLYWLTTDDIDGWQWFYNNGSWLLVNDGSWMVNIHHWYYSVMVSICWWHSSLVPLHQKICWSCTLLVIGPWMALFTKCWWPYQFAWALCWFLYAFRVCCV